MISYRIEIGGMTAKLSRTQSTGADFEKFRALLEVATVFAAHIRDRVRDRGQLADAQYAQPFGTSKVYRVSKEYSEKAGAGGQMKFASSAAFHGKIQSKVGTYKASGGMWQGMAVQGRGESVTVNFKGDSEGSGVTTMVPANHGKFMIIKKVSGNASNALKAGQILRRQNVNILTPSQSEIEAMQQVYLIALQRKLIAQFGGVANLGMAGDGELFGKLAGIAI